MVITSALVHHEDFDVGFRIAINLGDIRMVATRLRDVEGIAVASNGYLSMRPHPRTLDELLRHDLIFVNTPRIHHKLTFRSDGGATTTLELKPTICSTDFGFIKEVTLAGGGIAVVPRLLVERELSDGRLIHVLAHQRVAMGIGLYLLYPAGGGLPSKVREFCRFVREATAAEMPTGAGKNR